MTKQQNMQLIESAFADMSVKTSAQSISFVEHMRNVQQLVASGKVPTIEPFLPLLFTLNGKPLTLHDHYHMSPMFKTNMSRRTVFKTARQVAKSASIAIHGITLANVIPFFRIFYLTPLYEQIRRFSNNYVKPFIENSPVRTLMVDTNCEKSVLQRSFRNGSRLMFSFALLDVSRTRGVSSDYNRYDEVQDMNPDHFTIIDAAMSHSNYGFRSFTGTPKTLDGPLEGLWQLSSQAEWVIRCDSCSFLNIPALEYHLEGMIGPYNDHISEQYPGTICFRCKRPLPVRAGAWWHRYPERRYEFAGYHVPQIILPLHYSRRDKWQELLYTRNNSRPAEFINEILGESVDSGQKLLTASELRAAGTLPWSNNPNDPSPVMLARLPYYKMRVLAIDWGGGGEQGVSFTVLAVLGITAGNKIDVLWGKRLVTSQDHLKEASECLHWSRFFKCDLVTHDYTGAGVVRETVMTQAGFDISRIMPIEYVRAASAGLIRFVPATPLHNRDHWRLDKVRSLLYTIQGIRTQLVNFFQADIDDKTHSGLMRDFLALIEEKTPTRQAGDIYVITRNLLQPDDFAQAVNIGCCALWHANDAWPDFAKAAAQGMITQQQELYAGSRDVGWEQDQGFFNNF